MRMRRIEFKPLTFEKQMTVLLPVVMLFLLLCGVLAVSRSREQVTADAKEGSATPSATAPVSTAPATHILLMLHGDALDYLTVMQIDPATPRITVCSVDPATALADGTAAQVYGKHGAPALQTELGETLATPLDFYIDFSYDGLRELIQYYGGGVTVHLPQAVSRTDETGLPVSFPAGELHLSGYQTYELMAAVAGEPDLCLPVASSLWCDLINRYVTGGRELTGDFSVLTSVCDTSIKIFHWESFLPTLREMVRYAPLAVVSR